jgi:ABC-type enterochelin transport system substrate-binding protein|uniref:hypothetical protein n=1 Tax=Daejeonella sp. TaxID=2805397 RepID=UPI004049E420
MKNSFKLGFLALAISLSVAACNSNKTEEAATDSVAVDSMAVDSMAVDSAAADTVAAN